MHKSKLCYVVEYGLAPHYTVKLQKHAKYKLYCFHFYETITSQTKKQYVGYATYKTKTEIVTTYFVSLLIGRCSAVKLREHMFKCLKKHQLEISNLVSIGMNGPHNHRTCSLQMVIMGCFQLDPFLYTLLTMDLKNYFHPCQHSLIQFNSL